MDQRADWSDRVKKFSNQVENWAGFVERFVEQNLVEKDQMEKQLKSLAKALKSRLGLPERVGLKVKKLEHFEGELPAYQSVWASGFDVRAQVREDVVLKPGERALIPTGMCFEIPQGFELQARPRSGWAIREGVSLLNTPGTIDSDYRGEVKIIVVNLGQEPVTIHDQDRIAQLVVCPVIQADFEVVEELSDTERGDGGFGSTGRG